MVEVIQFIHENSSWFIVKISIFNRATTMIKGAIMGKLNKKGPDGNAIEAPKNPEQMDELKEAAKELKAAADAHEKRK